LAPSPHIYSFRLPFWLIHISTCKHTKFSLLLNLPTYISLSLFSPLETLVLLFCHHFLTSSSSLKITNVSFRFASLYRHNQLPVSFRQSTNQSPSHLPRFIHGGSCTSSSFLPSLTPLFHSGSKPIFFTSLSHQGLLVSYPWTTFSELDRFSGFLCSLVCFIYLSLFLFSFWSHVVD